MRVEINIDQHEPELFVEIHCNDVTDNVSRLKRHIEKYGTGIKASKDGETVMLKLSAILYAESVDKKTFVYTESKVYETDKRLYELEEMLDKRDFFRCSKSVIINISKIEKLKPEITRNILATLSNGEVIVVSRRYATELKKLIGIS